MHYLEISHKIELWNVIRCEMQISILVFSTGLRLWMEHKIYAKNRKWFEHVLHLKFSFRQEEDFLLLFFIQFLSMKIKAIKKSSSFLALMKIFYSPIKQILKRKFGNSLPWTGFTVFGKNFIFYLVSFQYFSMNRNKNFYYFFRNALITYIIWLPYLHSIFGTEFFL